MFNTVLIRYGELFLKRGNRRMFLDQLQTNLRQKIRGIPATSITELHGRFIAFLPDNMPDEQALAITRALASTFGVSSVSPALLCPPAKDVIMDNAVELCASWLERNPVKSFKVACARPYKRHPFDSMEVNRDLGERVMDRFGLQVRMSDPEMLLSIEVHREKAFIFFDTIPGPGGLPVGSSGKVLALMSGGIDSPVAAWMMAKRGCSLDAVYFHSFPYISEKSRGKVLDLAGRLTAWHGPMDVYTVPFTKIQEYLRDNVKPSMLVLAYRRSMVRISCALAARLGAGALVTGESLGQVASQTMENLTVIEDASKLPVFRPLLAFDKAETVLAAKRIGTFDTSILPFDDCCSLFAPEHPSTGSRVWILTALEGRLAELPALEGQALEQMEVVTVGGGYRILPGT